MRIAKTSSALASLLLAAACGQAGEATDDINGADAAGAVTIDLRVRDNPENAYVAVSEFTVPASHEIGDGMMPYEGIGWENGLVGYRLYLDGRLVSDIFGKQKADAALAGIDEYGSYHELADWGMDVLKVGPSLGIGGIGVMRNGEPMQFGAVPELSATIGSTGGSEGSFTITTGGIDSGAGETGGYSAVYSIAAGSPMTSVAVDAEGNLPLTSGIVMHEGAEFWQSAESDSWRYIATFGTKQSENKDGLGMALFYRADEASYGGMANQTHYVTFADNDFTYGFLAAWELDPQGITDRESFSALLEAELAKLEGEGE